MKRTSKQKRPQKQKSKHTVHYSQHRSARLSGIPIDWLIYFYGPNNQPVCGITRDGEVEWHKNEIRTNYLKRAFNSGITVALEYQAGIKKGARRRMVLKSFKHIRNKIKKMDKKEMVKYLNTTIKALEKKETIRILQGKD